VARAAIDAIRAIDPQRLVISDGCSGGVTPVADLARSGAVESPHDYYPPALTHYQCEWARGWLRRSEPPTWPLKDSHGKVIADRKTIAEFLRPWGGLERLHVPIHFGEMGCYKHTPPQVVLAWFDDTPDAIRELDSGWALWNFRGPFGIVDTGRPGTKYEDWHGHQLDRPLLNLLSKNMK
jgi:endoglucanase